MCVPHGTHVPSAHLQDERTYFAHSLKHTLLADDFLAEAGHVNGDVLKEHGFSQRRSRADVASLRRTFKGEFFVRPFLGLSVLRMTLVAQ